MNVRTRQIEKHMRKRYWCMLTQSAVGSKEFYKNGSLQWDRTREESFALYLLAHWRIR